MERRYQIDDMVVYGNTGVCRIVDVTVPDFIPADKEKVEYYVLAPVNQDGFIYTPVDTKVFMRPIISKEKANELIDRIPTIQAEVYHSSNMQDLKAHYEAAFTSHDCADLIELSMSIYMKKQYLEQQKKKFGQTDAKFMKKAEDLLFNELAAALGIKKDEVPGYISARIHK